MSEQRPNISVIIPTLNEGEHLAATLARVTQQLPEAEIIVVDGGSRDLTLAIATQAGAIVVSSPPGRGVQLRTGASRAQGALLLFLHADTHLPTETWRLVDAYFQRDDVHLATFRLRFDEAHWFLRASAWFTRFDSVFTRFGDQGIVIRREFYETLGGFPEWPLFEDVELLRRGRRLTKIWSLPATVTTSSRRFRQRGIFHQQWLNARLLLRFLAGASPADLARQYRS